MPQPRLPAPPLPLLFPAIWSAHGEVVRDRAGRFLTGVVLADAGYAAGDAIRRAAAADRRRGCDYGDEYPSTEQSTRSTSYQCRCINYKILES